jgi:magnesium transporter
MSTDTRELFELVEDALKAGDPQALAATLEDIHAADLAEIYESLDEEHRSELLFALPPAKTAEVIVMLDEAERGELVEDMNDRELSALATRMEVDDAADVLGELPEDQQLEVLERISREHADKIKELLTYDEDSAGGIMTKDLISLPVDATVGEAIRKIRSSETQRELHNVYVTDESMRLFGVVPLKRLVLNEKHVRLGDIAVTDPISVNVNDDQEHVIHIISKYDCVAVPVVDDDHHLLGKITHDDIMDVYEEETDEDIYRMVGIDAAEFERSSILRAAGLRLSWLIPCLASMAITAGVMMISQAWFNELAVYAALVIFVPMIGAIGGNSGIQIATVIVRGLATNDFASSQFKHAFFREGRIALVMAPACGVAAAGLCRFGLPLIQKLSHAHVGHGQTSTSTDPVNVGRISLAVGIGMTCAILIAGMLGILLPFVFRKLNVDPAIASGPIVTTANDIISVTIFLALSSIIVMW